MGTADSPSRRIRREAGRRQDPEAPFAWQSLGVRKADGGNLPKRDLPAVLVRPSAGTGRVFAVYSNYQSLLRWNRSSYFAVSVGILSDRIAGR